MSLQYGPTWDNGQQIVPPAAHPSRVTLNQLLQGDGELLLHRAGAVDVAADAEKFGACTRAAC